VFDDGDSRRKKYVLAVGARGTRAHGSVYGHDEGSHRQLTGWSDVCQMAQRVPDVNRIQVH
jgi:hypothetical protein